MILLSENGRRKMVWSFDVRHERKILADVIEYAESIAGGLEPWMLVFAEIEVEN